MYYNLPNEPGAEGPLGFVILTYKNQVLLNTCTLYMLVPVTDFAWPFLTYNTLVLFMFHVMMCSIFAQAIHNYSPRLSRGL